jgi:hypothetical protein
MKDSQRYFDIYPRIVKEGKERTIKVVPLFDHKKVKKEARYELVHTPMETRRKDEFGFTKETMEIYPIDGYFEISLVFGGEQEHCLEIIEVIEEESHLYCSFSIYSLEEDLYNLRPYKGDMHMHSYYSDGRESPAYVAGSCRKIGLDFMALTDHGQYQPSIESQEAYSDIDIDLVIFPGEEIHPPENDVHMINFGGDFSINDLIKQDTETYLEEVRQIKREEKASGLTSEEQYKYASCKWCFDKIREGGGLGIYCHPYWVTNSRYNVSMDLHDYIYKNKPFDAYELIGGFHRYQAESNHLQVTHYQEERAKGRIVPIVGVTDAHGCDNGELFGWYYTIVFSPDLKLNSLIESIRALNSVAIEALPDNPVRVYGPYRLVKYALFLIREIYPFHDELCYEEGKLMLEYISGNIYAADMLKNYNGRVARKMEKFWG